MSVTPRKFEYSHSFDPPAAQGDLTAELRAAELAVARAEAEQAGFANGLAAARATLEAQATDAVQQIARTLKPLLDSQHDQMCEVQKSAAQLAFDMAETLADAALEHFPFEQVLAFIHSSLQEVLHHPRIVIRLHASVFETVKNRVEDIAIGLSYPGKLIFLSDDSFQSHDVEIAWAMGGVCRKPADIAGYLRAAVRAFIANMDAQPQPREEINP